LLNWLSNDPKEADAWRAALMKLTGEDHGAQVMAWQKALWRQPSSVTNGQWVFASAKGPNPDVARAAVALLARFGAGWDDSLVQILRDPALPAMLRYQVITSGRASPAPQYLAALVDLLGDPTPVDPAAGSPVMDETFPFYDQLLLRTAREQWREHPPTPVTLGTAARSALKQYSKQDHGDDAAAWREALGLAAVASQNAGTSYRPE
ncbi:MAG TPA: hypothetical protein VH518_16610, partial [Tepidisphaeraceae bacterium]